jgi:hypothetical protein
LEYFAFVLERTPYVKCQVWNWLRPDSWSQDQLDAWVINAGSAAMRDGYAGFDG